MTRPHLRTIYEQIGPETFDELVEAFYLKVYADPNLIPIFHGGINEIMRKQRLFLTQFTGGPLLYSEGFGRPAMRSRHLPHEITPARAESWLRCMKEFEEIGLDQHPAGEEFFERLKAFASIMVNTDDTDE